MHLCNNKILMKLKEKVYQMAIQQAILHESECWTNNATPQLLG